MKYENVEKAVFLERPNRFIARVELDGRTEVCHVKNTGRCKELLLPGVPVWLQRAANPGRKTKYDLIAVQKGDKIINIDSQIPNAAAREWLERGEYFRDITMIKSEKTYRNSRFDLYIEAGGRKIFIEVKGVTLEQQGIARFPDAPTLRGIKHIRELQACISDGYEAYILFVIQMKGIHRFEPNDITHRVFGDALREAYEKGVHILAYDCRVSADSIELDAPIAIKL